MKYLLIVSLLLFSSGVFSNSWREGKVTDLASGYDGSSITFRLYDLTADSVAIDYSKCTCNSSWQALCLNPVRENFDKEYSMLLAASSANRNVRVIFNDEQCFIRALVIPRNS